MDHAIRPDCVGALNGSHMNQIIGSWCRNEAPNWHLLHSDQDWHSLAQSAVQQEVGGLLYAILPEHAPQSVKEALRIEFNSQRAANLLYLDALKQILPEMQHAKMRFVLIKGAALLATVYPNPGMRAMSDVDILVNPDDANILKPLMQRLGWEFEDEDIAGPGFGERYRSETAFRRMWGDLLLRIEAHLDVPGFYPPSRSQIWQEITYATIDNVGKVPVLNLPTHLSYLCAHYYYHHCGLGLKWLVDIARLASQVTSWREVVVHAFRFGATRPVHLVLQELDKRLGTPVPNQIVDTLRFLPMPLSLRLLFELCKRRTTHYLGIRLLDIYRAPTWSRRFGYMWRKLTAPRWRKWRQR